MNDSSALVKTKFSFPRPSLLALVMILVAHLSLLIGILRYESVLMLVGIAFFVMTFYAFLGILIIAWVYHRRFAKLSCTIIPRESAPGEQLQLFPHPALTEGGHFSLPGILYRYEVQLRTKDGRIVRQVFDPRHRQTNFVLFSAPQRGAYFGAMDTLRCFDALGLFNHSLPVEADTEARLLIRPQVKEKYQNLPIKAGGVSRRVEQTYRQTEDLTDHRPYVPGDDPRRINWKLYSHSGDLFIRKGEEEPPPRSRTHIVLDTTTDTGLFDPVTARSGVDLLTEIALGMIVEAETQGCIIQLSYPGSSVRIVDPQKAAEILAYPYAINSNGGELPKIEDAFGLVILALPRLDTRGSPLDVLLESLRRRGSQDSQSISLYFIGMDEKSYDTAQICVRRYSGIGRVHAARFQA